MKKIFPLTHDKKKPERLLEAIKHDIKKYMKRERSKKLPENATFWDFTFKFGTTQEDAKEMTHLELNKELDAAVENKLTQCYIEILAKASFKEKAE